jgi:predicted small lipoprotein YifL
VNGPRSHLGWRALGALLLALGLAACGVKGPLEPPPGSGAPPPAAAAAPPAQHVGPSGLPPTPAGEQKRLPMDWLLD